MFGSSRRAARSRAHTLREFVAALEELDVARADGYLRRSDFSRWIADVFGDHALARELHEHERRYVHAKHRDAPVEIVAAIRSRYDLRMRMTVQRLRIRESSIRLGQASTQAIQL